MINSWKWSLFTGHPSEPNAEIKSGGRAVEHPSRCNAERVIRDRSGTIEHPSRGDLPSRGVGQVRSALGPEGCSVVPANSSINVFNFYNHPLPIRQCRNTRQLFSFEVFQAGTASGGYVGYFFLQSGFFDSCG
jgi:hypothetical protein